MTVPELYKEHYGRTFNQHKPDLERCCVEVADYSSNWPHYHQCSRRRGHGPHNAYCKQHDPETVKARSIVQTIRTNANWNKERYKIHGRAFFDVLSKIADGHHDARGLAREAILKFKEGET